LHYPLKKVNFVSSEYVMAEDLIRINGSKEDVYQNLIPQLKGLLDGETDLVANLANVAAALKESFGFFWVGFYLVRKDELVLGPFQGPVACTRIQKGRGVCGKAWELQKTLIVPDVEAFPGHIACSSLSKSEIVIPLVKHNTVLAVLDVDSDELNSFDQTDEKYLNEICQLLCAYF
jgi:L-methionine (R)-S-oxide reductase